MSKDLIKEYLEKFKDAENCDNKNSSACEIVGNLQQNIDNIDLRFNNNKQEICNTIGLLNSQDNCTFCDTTDGLALALKDKWSKNKIGFLPSACEDPHK